MLAYTGYIAHDEGSLIQNAATNQALFFMTTLLPALGYMLMLIPMAFYNISGQSHRRMIAELDARHAKIRRRSPQLRNKQCDR